MIVLYRGGNSIESLECSCLSTLKLFAQFIVDVVKQRFFVLDAATAMIHNDEGRTKEEDKTEKVGSLPLPLAHFSNLILVCATLKAVHFDLCSMPDAHSSLPRIILGS